MTSSTYGLGEHKYNFLDRTLIADVNNEGLDVQVYLDGSSEFCLSSDNINLSEAIPKAFPDIHNFFSGHKVHLILTRKDNFTLDNTGSEDDPIVFAVRLKNCDGINENVSSIMGAVEIVYHEMFHLEARLRDFDLDSEKEEKNAVIFGICAILNSAVVTRFELPNFKANLAHPDDIYLRKNLEIRKSAYEYIASHFESYTVDFTNPNVDDKIKSLCDAVSL